MPAFKLISDFDGVWTNQDEEAAFVQEYILKQISNISGFRGEKVSEIISGCRKEMDRTPYEWGWMNNGSIACYYGEDPFGDNNAILDFIDRSANEKSFSIFKQELYVIKKSILSNGFASLDSFSNKCFFDSTKKFKELGKLTPGKNIKKIVGELIKQGIETVVASNSKTEKIEYLFIKAGVPVSTEKSIKRSDVHARGGSIKFVIDNDYDSLPEFIEVTKRFKPNLRRKNYFKVLSEEKPDFVIGDVFSLDLALPLYLRMNDKNFSNLKVIQKVHKHTPTWVKDFLSKYVEEGIAGMIDEVDELPDAIRKLK